jgi:hypothetical protein
MSDNPYTSPERASRGALRGDGDVRITDIDIPFGRMVMIILKWMFASIPAMIIMWFLMFIVLAILGAVFGASFKMR